MRERGCPCGGALHAAPGIFAPCLPRPVPLVGGAKRPWSAVGAPGGGGGHGSATTFEFGLSEASAEGWGAAGHVEAAPPAAAAVAAAVGEGSAEFSVKLDLRFCKRSPEAIAKLYQRGPSVVGPYLLQWSAASEED